MLAPSVPKIINVISKGNLRSLRAIFLSLGLILIGTIIPYIDKKSLTKEMDT